VPNAYFKDRAIHCVLFDLDGTLADTAPDLANALNYTLNSQGFSSLPLEKIRPAVTFGGMALIKLGFLKEPANASYEDLRQTLLQHYQENLHVDTQLFDGIEQVLQVLATHKIKWGIVTNKPSWLTDPLVKAMQLDKITACIISGDTTAHSKPHPAPLFHACKISNTKPAQTLFIGDAITDIQAGKSAGMATIAALYGYISHTDAPSKWNADLMIQHPSEILSALGLKS